MSGQAVLPIDAPHQPTFDNLVVGDNAELCNTLKSQANGFSGYWLCGEDVCGKTHLLRATCLSAVGHGHLHAYLDCTATASQALVDSLLELIDTLRNGQDLSATIAIDHADEIRGERVAEEALMALYNAMHDGRGDTPRRLMVAHRQPAGTVSFSLADLNSRLRALAHHQLASLNDPDKSQVLRIRAEQRGYHLSDSVVEYWLRRGPRGIDRLLADLERLDAATLRHKRLLTVPLLKSVLGY